MMDLETALAYVRAGKKVRRRSWQPREKYVCLTAKRSGPSYYAICQDRLLRGEYSVTPEDFGAYDWECFKEEEC